MVIMSFWIRLNNYIIFNIYHVKYLKTYESFNIVNFKKWFGNSKMIDKNGQPKEFYHGVGRAGKFDTFNKDLIGVSSGNHGHFGIGFYFTDKERSAKSFSEFFGGTGEVISVYLKIENPFYVNEESLIKLGEKYDLNLPTKVDLGIDIKDLLEKVKNVDLIAHELLSLISKHDDYEKGWEEFLNNHNGEIPESKLDLNTVADWYEDTTIEKYGSGVSEYTIEELRNIGIEPKIVKGYGEDIRMDYLTDLGQSATSWTDAIKKEGYDGIVAGEEFVVFEPSQIKSVENKGKFNLKSDNIYESITDYISVEIVGSGEILELVEMDESIYDRIKFATFDTLHADYTESSIKNSFYVVLFKNDLVIGMCRVKHYSSKKSIIQFFSIDENYRGNEYANKYGVKFIDRKDSDDILESYNDSLTPIEILNYINDLHEFGYDEKKYEDWEWINKFEVYRLEDVKLSDLKISAMHPPLVKKYSLLETEIPPIVVDSESMFILDGNHRAKACEIRGDEYIKAYVGYKNLSESLNNNFKLWFGDSKVVNEDGSPKVMYHGSPNLKNIQEFRPKNSKQWYFFTDSEDEAWRYSGFNNENIGKFYVRAEKIFNPKELSREEKVKAEKFLEKNVNYFINQYSKDNLKYLDEEWESYEEDLTEEQRKELSKSTGGWVMRLMDRYDIVKHLFYYNLDNYIILESDLMQEYIKSNGYDSFTTLESGGGDFNIAVYSPNQIKSVNNNGIFSLKNNNIYEKHESNRRQMVMAYHGTPHGSFDTFSYNNRGTGADRHGMGDYGKGFYFTPNRKHAIAYANGLAKEGIGKLPYLYTVELEMNKPFDMRMIDKYRNASIPLIKKYGALNIPDDEYDKLFKTIGITEKDYEYILDMESHIGDNWADWNFEKILGEKGFDSIISYDGDEYIVFRPEQIKIIDKQAV